MRLIRAANSFAKREYIRATRHCQSTNLEIASEQLEGFTGGLDGDQITVWMDRQGL